ncbi:GerAB/ArcD/ProY family transporter [Shimazuella kribbensis]|uniref:GerAB/ArcD/ProY family transporter n=1 Tax=Shimazuella kribbensis TaxID=139808 RepID=UPI00041A8A95|nr:endospore germination permease [Shimazuella kribbensis]
MAKKSFQLSFSQYVFLIYKTQIGVGVLTIPHDIFIEGGGSDGWIAIILGWIITNAVSFLILNTMKNHPNDTLFDLIPKYFGRWLGKVIIFGWFLYVLFAASFSFLYSVFLIKVWVLPNTNPLLIGLLFIIPIYQITRKGIPMISRFAQFTFLITLWMIPTLFFSIKNGIWLNLLPLVRDGWMPIFKVIPMTSLSFLGFELAFFLYPYLKNKKDAYKGILISNTMTACVLIFVTILSYIRLSDSELVYDLWPTLDLLKLIRFPFLERLEIIFISGYIIILFMTVIPYLFIALDGSRYLTNRRSITQPALIIILLGWLGILYSSQFEIENIVHLKKWLSNSGKFFGFIFPICLWLYGKIFLAIKKERLDIQ